MAFGISGPGYFVTLFSARADVSKFTVVLGGEGILVLVFSSISLDFLKWKRIYIVCVLTPRLTGR